MAAIASSTPSIPAGEHVQVSLPHIGLLPATVETTEPAKAKAIRGTLELDDSRPELLRVVLSGDSERIQRREWARVEATLQVTVKGIDEPVGGDTVTLNISGGGILVKDLWKMPLGIDVRIELEVEPGVTIKALGRVVREPAPDQKGIRIDSIGREDSERLVRLVRERELAALRMSRGR